MKDKDCIYSEVCKYKCNKECTPVYNRIIDGKLNFKKITEGEVIKMRMNIK